MRDYLFNVLLGLDLMSNALLGGSYYQTLSARAYLAALHGNRYWSWTQAAINALARDQDHCARAYRFENRPDLPHVIPTVSR